MNVELHDADRNDFPNYALMKLSAFHKQQGDAVEWWLPYKGYDIVYSSKVFTFTPDNPALPHGTIKGGTGYGEYAELPPAVDDVFPDYSIYPSVNYAIGFLTRGCIRKCPWCVVPKKRKEAYGHTGHGKKSSALIAEILSSWTTMFSRVITV